MTEATEKRLQAPEDRATLVGLTLALFAPPALVTLPAVDTEVIGNVLKWILATAVLAIAVFWEDESLSSVGFVRPRLVEVLWILFLVIVSVAVFALTDPLINALGLPTQQDIEQPSLVYGLFTAFTAGVTEEILYRGYPVERLVTVGYRPVTAGAVTWLLFVFAHLLSGYPSGNLVQISIAALVITAVYVRTRSLFPVVVGHILVDAFGVLAFLYA